MVYAVVSINRGPQCRANPDYTDPKTPFIWGTTCRELTLMAVLLVAVAWHQDQI